MAAPSPSERLLAAARAVIPLAVAPYSRFQVGAAIEDIHGGVTTGVNVESVSYGLSLCAERTALFSALARGAREFRRLAVVSATTRPLVPCGACRQVLLEHAPDLILVLETDGQAIEEVALRDLLPRPFTRIDPAP